MNKLNIGPVVAATTLTGLFLLFITKEPANHYYYVEDCGRRVDLIIKLMDANIAFSVNFRGEISFGNVDPQSVFDRLGVREVNDIKQNHIINCKAK